VARLHPQPYPGDWKLGDVTRKNVTRIDAQLTAIPNVISFPVGDGKAYYHVKSERPLVLQHIPCAGAYQISDAHMRGLTLDDVKQLMR
jgi:hypothetical protein